MDIMQAILDIEQKAQGIVDSAEELKESRKTVLENEIKEMENKAAAELRSRRERMEREAAEKRREAMENLEKSYAEKLETLDKKCAANKEKWIDDIVNAVISG